MGLAYSSLMKLLAFSKKNVRIHMVGLEAAGTTTILYKLKLGEVISTIPTIGYNVETLDYKNLRLTVYDIGGQQRIRHLYYFTNTVAVIFVIDSADSDRMSEAANELHMIMERFELKDAVLLVYANKQDLPGAMNIAKIAEALNLNDLRQNWHVHGVCATKGTGLWEGLDKLVEMLNKQQSIRG